MKKTKRPFSVLLALAMLLSGLYLPARAAEGGREIAVLRIQKIANGTTYSEESDPDVTEAAPGDVLVLTVGVKNRTSAAIGVTSLTTRLGYNPTLVAPAAANTLGSPFAKNPYTVNRVLTTSVDDEDNPGKGWSPSSRVDTENASLNITGAGSNDADHTYTIEAGGEMWLYRAAFVVREDAEAGQSAAFTFNQSECELGVSGASATADFVDGSVSITGAPASEWLDITPASQSLTVPADGEAELTVDFTAVQNDGTTPSSVTWTLNPQVNGVRMVNGTLHVSNEAKTTATREGFSITLNASSGALKGSAALTLILAESVLTSLSLSPSAVLMGRETEVRASMLDQYGMAYDDGDISISTPGSTGGDALIVGTYNSAEHYYPITVPADAEGTFIITASAASGGQTAEQTLVVSSSIDAGPASVLVSPNQASAVIPVPGADGSDEERTFTAVVRDADDNILQTEVEWATSPALRGVSIDENGKVTISADARMDVTGSTNSDAAIVYVTAKTKPVTTNSKVGTAVLTLKRAPAVLRSLELSQTQVELNASDAAHVQMRTLDQYGTDISGAEITISPANAGVYVSGDELVVARNARPGTYQITASLGSDTTEAAVLTVGRQTSQVRRIVINQAAGRSIVIPADGVDGQTSVPATASFSATVYDQFNEVLPNEALLWQIDRLEGVSIDPNTGYVQVANEAKSVVTDTAGMTLNVSASSVSAPDVKAESTLIVQRSAPIYSSIRILANGAEIVGADTLGIPSSKTYSTQILDQYGTPVSGISGNLELVNPPYGVTLTGRTVTVDDESSIQDGRTAILRATHDNLPSTDVTLFFRNINVNWIQASDITYGQTRNEAFYGVPGPGTAVQGGGTSLLNGEFSVVDQDVLLSAGNGKNVVLRFTANINGTEVHVDKTYSINVRKKDLYMPTQEPMDVAYEGQTSFQISGVTPVGLVAGDSFTYTISGDMIKRAGDQNALISSAVLDDPAKAGVEANYQLPEELGEVTLRVTKRSAHIVGVHARNSRIPYASDNEVELEGGQLVSIIPGDDVSFVLGTGTLEGDSLGTNVPVTTHITLTGADAENYELIQPVSVTVTVLKMSGVEIETSDLPSVSTDEITDSTLRGVLTYSQTGIQEFQSLGTGDNSPQDDPTNYVYRDVYSKVEELHPGGEVTAEVIVHVRPLSFDFNEGMSLETSLSFQVYDADHTPLGGETALHSLSRPVTMSLNIPSGWTPGYARHTRSDGTQEYMGVSVSRSVATWKQQNFSPVELLATLPTLDDSQQWQVTDANGNVRPLNSTADLQAALNAGGIVSPVSGPAPVEDTASVTFLKSDGTAADTLTGGNPRTFRASDVDSSLPQGSETGFLGWTFPDDSTVYTTLTEALWNRIKKQTVSATASVQTETPVSTVTIRFQNADGTNDTSISPNPGSYKLGDSLPARTASTGTFHGWVFDGTGDTTPYTVLTSNIWNKLDKTGEVIAKASIQDTPVTVTSITIRFMQRDGTTVDPSLGAQSYTTYGDTVTLPTPSDISGYTFQHWTISGVTGGVKAVTSAVWNLAVSTSGRTVNAVPVYVADNTDENKVSITFLNPDGSISTNLANTTGGTITAESGTLQLPTMSSYSDSAYTYTFQGWLVGSATVPVMSIDVSTLEKGSSVTAKPSYTQTATYSGGGGGGGGGGGSRRSSYTTATTTYSITCTSDANGTVSANETSAASGTVITLTITPNSGYELDILTVKNQNGNNLILGVSGSQRTFTMPSGAVTVNATFKQTSPAPVDSGDSLSGSSFTDIAPGHPFYNAILWAAQNGITTGTTPTTFSPDMSCTRAQAVTFFWRSAGQPEPVNASNPFVDVSPDAYYYKAVLWAVEQEITNGTTPTTFSPNNTVSRGQIVTFLHRWSGSPLGARDNPFTDVWRAPDVYFYDAVLWAVEQGITNGTSPTTFEPTLKCTRGQIVTFLYRYMVL